MTRHRIGFLFLVVLVAAFAAMGCGSRTQDQAATPAPEPTAAPAVGGLLAKSLYDDGPRAGEKPVDAAQAAEGATLFKAKVCSACHGFGVKLSGPDLKGVSMRRTALWMQNQIMHPDVMTKTDPIAHGLFAIHALQMPNLALTAEQANQLIEYLKNRDKLGK